VNSNYSKTYQDEKKQACCEEGIKTWWWTGTSLLNKGKGPAFKAGMKAGQ